MTIARSRLERALELRAGDSVLGADNPMPTRPSTGAAQVGTDQTAAWANSDAIDTPVNIDLAQPAVVRGRYRVQVHNPSAVTALTVVARNIVTLGGQVRYARVQSFAVAAGETIEALVDGLFGGDGGVRLVLTNDTALGASDGFTADVAVREA